MPALGIIPSDAPLAFSYGVIPYFSRIVVSQGLLDQLADDEIATIYANEVGHLSRWTVPLMSTIAIVLQLPYTLYRISSEWGNQKQAAISKASAGLISAISYGLFWVWRWIPLWFARQRTRYSDRVAVELTGNPNGYTRALLKIAIGTAADIQTQAETSYLLEGFEVLTPLGYRVAAPMGSLYPHMPLESALEWERTNPYRHWLAIPNPHPPLGERLNLLMLYARHWKLPTELDWQDASRQAKSRGLSGAQWRTLLFLGSPYFGLLFGLVLSLLLSMIGQFGIKIDWDLVSWMARDRTIRLGLPLIGFCIGTLLRLNPFFPDIKPSPIGKKAPSDNLPDLMQSPEAIPSQPQPVRLEGQLIGRSGISNLLNQDLFLQTPRGLIKLHFTTRLGPFGNLLPLSLRPADLVKRSLVATGWFRRGATPWVDIDLLRTCTGQVDQSYHPIWSFVVAVIAAIWGILVILNIRI